MSHHTPIYQSGVMGPHHSTRRGVQQNPQGRFPPADPNAFHREIQRLRSLLEMERARSFEGNQKLAHLEAELEETKLQLKRQKALKETFINKNKEVKRELERVEKFSDPAVLNAAVIASKVHNDVKCKKKKDLQQDFEELKVAHLLSQESFVAEIQAEREKSKTLQEELDAVQTSYKELRSRYEADVSKVKQEAETQKLCEAKLIEERRLLEDLRAEKDHMFQDMSEKIALLQDNEKLLKEEMNQVKLSYNNLICQYESQVSGLERDMKTYRQQVKDEKEANSKRANENLQLIDTLRAEKEEMFQKMSREITIMQKMEKLLLDDLDRVHLSKDELKSKYNTDVMELQQQLDTYKQKTKKEETALVKREQNEKLIHELQRRFSAALHQKVENLELQLIQEREAHVKKSEEDVAELEKVKALYQQLTCRYESDVTSVEQQVKKYQEMSFVNELERAKQDLLVQDSLRGEKEDLQGQEEENTQSPVSLVKAVSQEVSSEEDLSGETLSVSSSDPESAEETEIAAETILEDLVDPGTGTIQEGQKVSDKLQPMTTNHPALFRKPSLHSTALSLMG
ncbi:cingulin-like protein 1 [Poecilia latipinna]|uniref:cingulin-like protein 1 n=1 Tax=Poecilia latipinna TaxID=48699 RepID=UPI00072E8682|nr:PREDICTED: cingulin-like protein 1 [Poecilia latipinna]